jgi:hypothetical protein
MRANAGKWSDFLSDRRSLDALYTETPELRELFEMSLFREGPQLSLRIELDRLPDPMPKKWAVQDCNRVQVIIRISALQEIRIAGWGTDNIVDVRFRGEPSSFGFELCGPTTRFEGTASHMYVERFTAYRVE